jgi:hypothetical protein
MASPHVAGAVALLWSCNPSLIGNMTATFELLQDTADTPPDGACGTPADGEGNYTYGYGYLNVLAAGEQVCSVGTIAGTVTNGNDPIEDATVRADDGAGYTKNIYSDANGSYSTGLPEGTYTLTASKYGYQSHTVKGVKITEGDTTTHDFVLSQFPYLYLPLILR